MPPCLLEKKKSPKYPSDGSGMNKEARVSWIIAEDGLGESNVDGIRISCHNYFYGSKVSCFSNHRVSFIRSRFWIIGMFCWVPFTMAYKSYGTLLQYNKYGRGCEFNVDVLLKD
jgi:hypothetical protein